MKICAIYDSKAKVYSSPVVFTNNVEAIRSFERTVNDPKSPMYKYREDFSIHALGELDFTNIADIDFSFDGKIYKASVCLAEGKDYQNNASEEILH